MQQNDDDEIEIELSEPQTAVLESRQSVTLDMSGQGGGKSKTIGYSTADFLLSFPRILGFIGANTYMQLSQSTLKSVYKTWADKYDLHEYDKRGRPSGSYVVNKKPPFHFKRFHPMDDYRGTISFYNGALCFIGSLENYKAHEGKEIGWAQLDETKDTDEKALSDVILGRLRQYGLWFHKDTHDIIYNAEIRPAEAEANGWISWNPLFIHTSPAPGGVKWLNEMFKLHIFEKDIKTAVLQGDKAYFLRDFDNKRVVIYSAYFNSPNVAPNFFENQKMNLQYENKINMLVHGYPFAKSGGEWYPFFRRDQHVRPVQFIPGETVHLTWDFNVVPYMTAICAHVQELTRYVDMMGHKSDQPGPGLKAIWVTRIRVYRNYCLANPYNSTEDVCDRFKADHDPAITEVYYYGDASGLHRIPGMGNSTNFKTMADLLYPYLHNSSKRVRDPNVGVFKRRDLLNRIFSGKLAEVEIEIDPSCEELIDDLDMVKEGLKGKVKKRITDKETGSQYEEHGHTSDALEYLVSELCKEHIT